jgi:hypothetical protein
VVIDKDSTVTTLSVADSAAQAEVEVAGKIGTVQVDNETAKVNVDKSTSGSSGGSSGGSSSGGSSSGGNDTSSTPVTRIFGLTILVSGGGSVYAEEVDETKEPEQPPTVDPIDPEKDGYPLIIQTGGHGVAIAEEYTEADAPNEEPEQPGEYIVRIQVNGQGTVVIQEIGG